MRLWPPRFDALSILVLLLCSVLRAAFTNNRVPVLQRCGSLKETLSQGHGARSTSQGGARDGARKVKECEGGQYVASVLAQTKGYHGEKVISSFEASRKRLLSPQEEEERDERERLAHPEKRARISAGENFISHKSGFAVFTVSLCKSSTTLRSFAPVHRAARPLVLARSAPSGEALELHGGPGARALEKVQRLKTSGFGLASAFWPR